MLLRVSAGTLDLNLDYYRNKLVFSAISETEFVIPSFTFGDVISVVAKILKFTGAMNSYQVADVASMGLSFRLTDTPANDASGSTAFVTQATWALDTTLRTLTANLSFNTAALSTWLSSAASKTATMRFLLTEGANTKEIYRRDVTIYAGTVSATSVAAGETALSLERALATFVKKLGAASEYRTLISQGGLKFKESIDEDGFIHYDPIT